MKETGFNTKYMKKIFIRNTKKSSVYRNISILKDKRKFLRKHSKKKRALGDSIYYITVFLIETKRKGSKRAGKYSGTKKDVFDTLSCKSVVDMEENLIFLLGAIFINFFIVFVDKAIEEW